MLPLLFRQGPVPEPLQKFPRLQIHQLHLICMIKDRIRDPVLYRDPGNGRHDIIQAVAFHNPDALIAFCEGIQAAAPVDSYVTPEPWAMPGYDSDVIMAAGAFVQGSSIELSADGPIKPPYAVYFQGGLTWYHAKLGILKSLQKLKERKLVNLDALC